MTEIKQVNVSVCSLSFHFFFSFSSSWGFRFGWGGGGEWAGLKGGDVTAQKPHGFASRKKRIVDGEP